MGALKGAVTTVVLLHRTVRGEITNYNLVLLVQCASLSKSLVTF